ncbi:MULTISPECIES: hypothetical protein [Tomitella]|uniref:Uncharacterized protein n=2 Tax=Tomitella TaxID=741759 RepID=A0A516X8T0_9ACTN|nr:MULTISPECIES: hypothetical protein [Tomitella]QDQ99485.1 hypothetical protein FO059_17960 [Tomitella fengzijianii]
MTPTPYDLYQQLYERRDQLAEVRATIDKAVLAYGSLDPAAVGTDTLGEPVSGPAALDETRDALARLARILTLADTAWDEATRRASRLRENPTTSA